MAALTSGRYVGRGKVGRVKGVALRVRDANPGGRPSGRLSFEALPHGYFDAQLFDRLIGRKRNVGGGVLADLPGLATAWVGR